MILIDLIRSSEPLLLYFSKYRDPLYLLLDYIAEVSITGPASYLCFPQYARS